MKSTTQKHYTTPQLVVYGPMEVLTQNAGPGSSIDGILGTDIDGDGTIDIQTGVTTGGPLVGSF